MLVQVSGQRFTFPRACARCGRPAEATLQAAHSKSKGKRVVHTRTWSWDFPYCNSCTAHVRVWRNALGNGFALGALTGFGVLILLAAFDAGDWRIVAAIVAGLIAWVVMVARYQSKARAMCFEECA